MPIQAAGGAGGFGSLESGGRGGDAGQNGSSATVTGVAGGAAGTAPNGDGGSGGSVGSNSSGSGSGRGGGGGGGGGGGADGSLTDAIGGKGGHGGTGLYGTVPGGGSSDAGGGGGGGGGGAGLLYASDLTVSGGAIGGNGGAGGFGGLGTDAAHVASGGDGGGGGDGVAFVGSGKTITLLAGVTVIGGAGGGGGGSYTACGNGGAGGDGLFAYDGNTVVNAGLIKGGSGGAGGTYTRPTSIAGRAGASGAGLVGSNLTVTNSGGIISGTDQYGNALADALTFTGGTNHLTLSSGGVVGTITGNITVNGTLDVQSGGTATSLRGGSLVYGAAGTGVTLGSDVALKDDVSGFTAGDTLDFRGVGYSAKLETVFTASATGGMLRVVDALHPTNVVASVTMTGSYTSGVFTLANDGSGGTKIGYTAAPPLGLAAGDVVTANMPGSSATAVVDRYNADYSLFEEATITKLASGSYKYHFQNGSFFTGKSFTSFDNMVTAAGSVTAQTLYDATGFAYQQSQFNPNGSLYLQDTVSKLTGGSLDYHYAGGSFFTGKSFTSFDNVTNAAGTLLSQTLYNASGQATQQTQYNGDGSVFQQDTITYPAAGQALHHYGSGSFFNDKSFSAFDNLITGGTLLEQELYNRDGSHSFSVPGSTLTIAAAHNDTFTITGHNDTIRFGATGFGADVVKGYTSGDTFSFAPSVFASYADLSSHVSGTSSAVLTDTHGDTLTLAGVAASSLTSSMFAFG